ncbi:hypothetical protein [Streptomyces sp. NBC_01207]|uniref:hypothetical protein n=1 Tax=Streptomyces sp. NBC_01207 TaxID=2903772 RepID=UPI002E1308E2|nr:hypothetical protein OG457_49795 [Streptomyces sp. NBC_01207]WSR21227.1 hypothetical protein OG457_49760 [Streptomyces sp. NBC_01207]
MYTRSWGAAGRPGAGLVGGGLVVLVVLVLVAARRRTAGAVPPTGVGRWVPTVVREATDDTLISHDETGTDAERPHRPRFERGSC